MSLSRSALRELCMKLVFQYDFHKKREWEAQTELFLDQQEDLTEEDRAFLKERTLKVYGLVPEIDEKIAEHSKSWKISRMSGLDRAVLRLAVFEMLYDEEIPESVAINEAVELAKVYGSDDSYKFVNGVLGGIAKEKQPE